MEESFAANANEDPVVVTNSSCSFLSRRTLLKVALSGLVLSSLSQHIWYRQLSSTMQQLSKAVSEEVQANSDITCLASVLAESETTYAILIELQSFEAFRVEVANGQERVLLKPDQSRYFTGLCKYEASFSVVFSRLSSGRTRVDFCGNQDVDFEIDAPAIPWDAVCKFSRGTTTLDGDLIGDSGHEIFSLDEKFGDVLVTVRRDQGP